MYNNNLDILCRVNFMSANSYFSDLRVFRGAWWTLLVMFIKFRIHHSESTAIKSNGYLQSSFFHTMKRSSTHQNGLDASGLEPPNITAPPTLTNSTTTFSFRNMSLDNYSMNSAGGFDMPIGRRIVNSETFPQDLRQEGICRTLPVQHGLDGGFRVVPGRTSFGGEFLLPTRFNRRFASVPSLLNNYGLHNFRQPYNGAQDLDYPLFRQLMAREEFSFSNFYERPVVLTAGGHFLRGRHLVQTNTEPETFNTIFNFIQSNMVDEGIVEPVWQVLSSLEDTSDMSLEDGFVEGVGALQVYDRDYDFSTESMVVENGTASQDAMDEE